MRRRALLYISLLVWSLSGWMGVWKWFCAYEMVVVGLARAMLSIVKKESTWWMVHTGESVP
jgi:hypothetical protein